MGKPLKVELLPTGFVIEDFGSNRTGIAAIGNAWRLIVLKAKSRKYQGVFEVKSRVKT